MVNAAVVGTVVGTDILVTVNAISANMTVIVAIVVTVIPVTVNVVLVNVPFQ